MKTTFDRYLLLKQLLLVEPGTSKRETRRQSSCFLFRRGYVYSLSMEVACAVECNGLDNEVDCAVEADKLLAVLKKLDSDTVDLAFEAGELRLKAGKARVVKIPLREPELPVDEVERPEGWEELDERFCAAIPAVVACCARSQKAPFGQRCVLLHPEYMEACDNVRLIRQQVNLPLDGPTLVRATSLAELADCGASYAAQTETWLHLHTDDGLRASVRTLVGAKDYPNHSPYLQKRGNPLSLPNSLMDELDLLRVFGDRVQVTMRDDYMELVSRSPAGECRTGLECDYKGPALEFSVPHKVLQNVAKEFDSVEVTPDTLRVEGESYTYVTSLR